MPIRDNIERIKKDIPPHITLIAVSKTYPIDSIMEAHTSGQKVFGENKAQEMRDKEKQLPMDIEWHLIGHLQTNKVRMIAPFVKLIHSVDSLSLLQEINKRAVTNKRTIDCLLQIFIAREETKYGLTMEEAEQLILSEDMKALTNIRIAGLMGMATNTTNKEQIRNEFKGLKVFFDKLNKLSIINCQLSILSMGMSSDYKIAMEEGSTMIRIGSNIFGERNYAR